MPAHMWDAVQSVAKLHAEHARAATPAQRAIERITARIGEPRVSGLVIFGMVCWMAANSMAVHFGYRAPDPPPFVWLTTVVSLASLYLVLLIFAAQRRDDQLTEVREQLTLELALLTEQKAAKTIELLEEFRRDIPLVDNRVDDQARAMAEPADPHLVVKAIKETSSEAIKVATGA